MKKCAILFMLFIVGFTPLYALEADEDNFVTPDYLPALLHTLDEKIETFIEQEKITNEREQLALILVVYHYLSMVMGSAYDAVRWHDNFRESGQECVSVKQALPIMHARQQLFKGLYLEKIALSLAKMTYTAPCYDYTMEIFEKAKITLAKDLTVIEAYRLTEKAAFSYLSDNFYEKDGDCWLKAAYEAALVGLKEVDGESYLFETVPHAPFVIEPEGRLLLAPLKRLMKSLFLHPFIAQIFA